MLRPCATMYRVPRNFSHLFHAGAWPIVKVTLASAGGKSMEGKSDFLRKDAAKIPRSGLPALRGKCFAL